MWHGRVTLEVRKPEAPRNAVTCLRAFDRNIWDLFSLDSDAEVRLWVRKGDFLGGQMVLELGN